MSTTKLTYSEVVRRFRSQTSPIFRLPEELHRLLLQSLKVPAILNLTSSCKRLRQYRTPDLWKLLLMRDFPIRPYTPEASDYKLYKSEHSVQNKGMLRLFRVDRYTPYGFVSYPDLAISDMCTYDDDLLVVNHDANLCRILGRQSYPVSLSGIKNDLSSIQGRVRSVMAQEDEIFIVLTDDTVIKTDKYLNSGEVIVTKKIKNIKQFIRYNFRGEIYNVILQLDGTLWLISLDKLKRWPIGERISLLYTTHNRNGLLLARKYDHQGHYFDHEIIDFPPFISVHNHMGYINSRFTTDMIKSYPILSNLIMTTYSYFFISGVPLL